MHKFVLLEQAHLLLLLEWLIAVGMGCCYCYYYCHSVGRMVVDMYAVGKFVVGVVAGT